MSNPQALISRTTEALGVAMDHVEWAMSQGMSLGEIADSIRRPIYPITLASVVSLLASEWVYAAAYNWDRRQSA
jgi:hypothetical protein